MYTSSSRTIWFYTAVLTVIALILFAVAPVSADVIKPINPTMVLFEKNGTPVNEPVTFRVNCFGYHSSSGKPPAQSQHLEPENVFWFSGTCPSYGCTIFERYYLANRYITSCDLEGQLNGENFIIRNFANTPKPNCTDPRDEVCTLRFTIPPERYVPTPTPAIHTPTPSQNSPIPGYIILISIILAGGLAMMIRKKKTR